MNENVYKHGSKCNLFVLQFNLSSLPLNNIINVTESSLTLLFDGKQLKDGISIEPMDLLTVKLDFS